MSPVGLDTKIDRLTDRQSQCDSGSDSDESSQSSAAWIPPDTEWTNIPFVNSVKNLGVMFDKKVTWSLYKEICYDL
jgi:hypothetical protein